VPSGSVLQPRKCAYGLTDAPRRRYASVLHLMTDVQLTRAPFDNGVFTQHSRGTLVFVVAVHVDGFLFGGTTEAVQRFESSLRGAFAARPIRSGALTFTGVRVSTVADDVAGGISIAADQEPYVDSLKTIDITPKPAATPDARLPATELTLYRRDTMALLLVMGQTMPYLACAASTLGRRFTRAAVHDLTAANRVVKAAKAARPLPLFFRSLRGDLRLHLFVYASSVKLGVPTAHTGVAVFASPATGARGFLSPDTQLTLLAYASHRQRRVTHFSFAAEVYTILKEVLMALELASTQAHVFAGDAHALAFIDVDTEDLSLYNTLDAAGSVQPKEVEAAVQELRHFSHGDTLATVTWLRARGKVADEMTKACRNKPL